MNKNFDIMKNIKVLYDARGNDIYVSGSSDWSRFEYDMFNNEIYRESSSGYWEKSEYDSKNELIYYESVHDLIFDTR
jgi:hypothetical protein